jgi:hypothetical protein
MVFTETEMTSETRQERVKDKCPYSLVINGKKSEIPKCLDGLVMEIVYLLCCSKW